MHYLEERLHALDAECEEERRTAAAELNAQKSYVVQVRQARAEMRERLTVLEEPESRYWPRMSRVTGSRQAS